jgi:hypothetical protein
VLTRTVAYGAVLNEVHTAIFDMSLRSVNSQGAAVHWCLMAMLLAISTKPSLLVQRARCYPGAKAIFGFAVRLFRPICRDNLMYRQGSTNPEKCG